MLRTAGAVAAIVWLLASVVVNATAASNRPNQLAGQRPFRV